MAKNFLKHADNETPEGQKMRTLEANLQPQLKRFIETTREWSDQAHQLTLAILDTGHRRGTAQQALRIFLLPWVRGVANYLTRIEQDLWEDRLQTCGDEMIDLGVMTINDFEPLEKVFGKVFYFFADPEPDGNGSDLIEVSYALRGQSQMEKDDADEQDLDEQDPDEQDPDEQDPDPPLAKEPPDTNIFDFNDPASQPKPVQSASRKYPSSKRKGH